MNVTAIIQTFQGLFGVNNSSINTNFDNGQISTASNQRKDIIRLLIVSYLIVLTKDYIVLIFENNKIECFEIDSALSMKTVENR